MKKAAQTPLWTPRGKWKVTIGLNWWNLEHLRRINKQTKTRLLSFAWLGFMRWGCVLKSCPQPELNAPATISIPKDTAQDGATLEGLKDSLRLCCPDFIPLEAQTKILVPYNQAVETSHALWLFCCLNIKYRISTTLKPLGSTKFALKLIKATKLAWQPVQLSPCYVVDKDSLMSVS